MYLKEIKKLLYYFLFLQSICALVATVIAVVAIILCIISFSLLLSKQKESMSSDVRLIIGTIRGLRSQFDVLLLQVGLPVEDRRNIIIGSVLTVSLLN